MDDQERVYSLQVVTGTDDDPSKWFQKPFTSTASMKWTRKIAQLSPSALSFGTVEGRMLDKEEVVTVDIVIIVDKTDQDNEDF